MLLCLEMPLIWTLWTLAERQLFLFLDLWCDQAPLEWKYTLHWHKFIQRCQANGMLKQKVDWFLQTPVTHEYQSAFYRMDHLACRGSWLQNVLTGVIAALSECFPIALHEGLTQFSCFSSPVLFFLPHHLCYFVFAICHVIFLFLCHCLNLLSPLHLSLMLNVIPPFFRLWFRWHLPRVAVIAKCRLGRWDIGQPLPFPLFHPSLPPSYLAWPSHSLCLMHAGYSGQ